MMLDRNSRRACRVARCSGGSRRTRRFKALTHSGISETDRHYFRQLVLFLPCTACRLFAEHVVAFNSKLYDRLTVSLIESADELIGQKGLWQLTEQLLEDGGQVVRCCCGDQVISNFWPAVELALQFGAQSFDSLPIPSQPQDTFLPETSSLELPKYLHQVLFQ